MFGLRRRLKALIRGTPRPTVELDLDEHLNIDIAGRIPIRARLAQRIDVRAAGPVRAVADVDQHLTVPVGRIAIPVQMSLQVPLDTTVRVQDVLHIQTKVAIDTVVTAMGVAPIPIKATIPLTLDIAIDQPLHITAELSVPIDEILEVDLEPLDIHLQAELPVSVRLTEHLPVEVDVEIDTPVEVRQTLPVRLQKTLVLTGEQVTFRPA